MHRVRIEIGMLTCVAPDTLVSAFELAAAGTPIAGTSLEVARIPGRGRCRSCGLEVDLPEPVGTCTCGSRDLTWVQGHELRLKSLEVS